jgi:hypothetical protein
VGAAHGSFCGLVCSLVERAESIRVFGQLAENGPRSPIEAEFAENLMRITESAYVCLKKGDRSFGGPTVKFLSGKRRV